MANISQLFRSIQNCLRKGSSVSFHTCSHRRKTFEPDYLDSHRHLPTTYPPVNIQIKGYDFAILESYQSYIHNMAENMGIDVSQSWATPATTWKAHLYEERSTVIKDTLEVHIYERNVQVENMRTVDAPILVDILRKTLPEGVNLSVHPHAEEHVEARYIPDPFIDSLRSELNILEEKRAKEMEGKQETKAAKEAAKDQANRAALYDDDDEDDEDY